MLLPCTGGPLGFALDAPPVPKPPHFLPKCFFFSSCWDLSRCPDRVFWVSDAQGGDLVAVTSRHSPTLCSPTQLLVFLTIIYSPGPLRGSSQALEAHWKHCRGAGKPPQTTPNHPTPRILGHGGSCSNQHPAARLGTKARSPPWGSTGVPDKHLLPRRMLSSGAGGSA